MSFSMCLIVLGTLHANVYGYNINASDIDCSDLVPRKPAPVVSAINFCFCSLTLSLSRQPEKSFVICIISGPTKRGTEYFSIHTIFSHFVSFDLPLRCCLCRRSTNVKTLYTRIFRLTFLSTNFSLGQSITKLRLHCTRFRYFSIFLFYQSQEFHSRTLVAVIGRQSPRLESVHENENRTKWNEVESFSQFKSESSLYNVVECSSILKSYILMSVCVCLQLCM